MKWEDLCLRCGLCCHEKVRKDDFLIILEDTCRYYDSENRLCKVYPQRFEKCDRCLKVTPIRAMFSSYLPPSCAYVLWAKRHHIRFAPKLDVVLSEEH